MSEDEVGQGRPFGLVEGGMPASSQRPFQRRWERPRRRPRVRASTRRPLRWTRSPAVARPDRDAAKRRASQSRRARKRRRKGPPWRLLRKETRAVVARTKSRAEYEALIGGRMEVLGELFAEWRRGALLLIPNGGDLVGGLRGPLDERFYQAPVGGGEDGSGSIGGTR